jgi:hypothetical protein
MELYIEGISVASPESRCTLSKYVLVNRVNQITCFSHLFSSILSSSLPLSFTLPIFAQALISLLPIFVCVDTCFVKDLSFCRFFVVVVVVSYSIKYGCFATSVTPKTTCCLMETHELALLERLTLHGNG